MMIPFTGACPIKQYVPNKPNPVGLKVYVLSNPSGIVCDLFVYEGKKTYPEDLKSFWECEGAVLLLTRSLVPGHILYCDRFFNTIRLAEELLNRGIRLTGTIMKSRLPTNTDLPDDQSFKKIAKGDRP